MKLTHLLLGALLTLPLSASTQPPSGAELPVSIAEANPSTLATAGRSLSWAIAAYPATPSAKYWRRRPAAPSCPSTLPREGTMIPRTARRTRRRCW